MNATTRKAMPAQNKLPVRNQTMSPMMAPGKMNRIIFAISTIMTIPIMRSSNSKTRSVSGGS